MLEKLEEVYLKLNELYLNNQFYPYDEALREQIKFDLEKRMGRLIISVQCDSQNNPPELAYGGVILASVTWKEYPAAPVQVTNVFFGNPWDVEAVVKVYYQDED